MSKCEYDKYETDNTRWVQQHPHNPRPQSPCKAVYAVLSTELVRGPEWGPELYYTPAAARTPRLSLAVTVKQ